MSREIESSRRGFVLLAGRATVAGCLAGSGALMSGCGLRYIPNTRQGNLLAIRKVDFEQNRCAAVKESFFADPIYVCEQSEGVYSAVELVCTHKGCGLDPVGDRIVCPCHGSEFALDGKVLKKPARFDLKRYSVTADETSVYIHVA